MLVMPANNCKGVVHFWSGRYGNLGHLFSPGSQRGPFPWLPYALDNGAFPAWVKGETWDRGPYLAMLRWAREQEQPPRWALVPDVVADRAATIASWRRWAPKLLRLGWPLAFAAQDGMTFADVPADASVVFLGGTTDWKRAAIRPWCARFPRVHVGRINTYKWLRECAEAGAESCDGTGWFRGDVVQLAGLERWLSENGGSAPTVPTSLFSGATATPRATGSRSSGTPRLERCGAGQSASRNDGQLSLFDTDA